MDDIALYLDIDGVLHSTHMKYGYERTIVVEERVPTELVHPTLRPGKFGSGSLRRHSKPTVRFETRVRVSRTLLADIRDLNVDVTMLTSWLEHDSVDAFWREAAPDMPYRKLDFPGRDFADPLGEVAARWKIDELHVDQARASKPFVWIDDDEVPIHGDEIHARYPLTPHLLIAPVRDIGLTRFHMGQVRDFVEDVRRRVTNVDA